MEEESWASCGNRDYLTPWDLSFLSTKSSPMLSMMLGVEGEDGPSCILKSFPHVYEYHLQCIFTFVASIFLQLLLVQSHGPNHCFTLSSPPSIPRCPIAASSSRIFLSISEQNLYWNNAPLRSARIFLSNESLFAQNWFRTRELCPFRPSAAICPNEFQNTQRSMFLPYLLVRVFKFIDLGCVGTEISWSFWILTFSSLYVYVHVQKLTKTAGLALKLWRCWRI